MDTVQSSFILSMCLLEYSLMKWTLFVILLEYGININLFDNVWTIGLLLEVLFRVDAIMIPIHRLIDEYDLQPKTVNPCKALVLICMR